jgi:putative oxidoreductase
MLASTPRYTGRLSDLAPLVLRLVLGGLMIAHAYQKISIGPAEFGRLLVGLGVPAFMGYVVCYTELAGGILLVVGLLSRLAALALIVDLVVAIALVKVNVGLIAPRGMGAGAELDLAYIASYLAILLGGPGRFSLDRLIGIDRPSAEAHPASSAAW